ncbi:site-specific integrase [Halomonas sp. TRM85114]|uniref:gamma-mobile-trio recombinase GmtY n=1 Tax=Halomonas jincaotanensis TaxID=2810616 RepID=UPI001BD5E4B0|nr:gamma-mobile-trio recombinase GmtY [Halomonas jincaotanensis]MBS9403091.1 site-specific integrase [Halomonas jincaotanensis]
MVSVRVIGKIVEDNTGVTSEIPLLMTAEGEVSSLTDYLLILHANGRSKSMMNKVVRSVAMLLEYLEANTEAFTDPEQMFQTFVRRLYSGTTSESGLDPSGLFWVPASETTVKERIDALSAFTEWLATKQGTTPLNPLRKASPHEERLNYAAWFRCNQNDFLGHIKDKSISTTVKRARSIKGRTLLMRTEDDAIAFPNAKFEAFFTQGIGGAKDPRVALRDKLILLLIHGAGLRISEAMLLWVTDVFEKPEDPSKAIVRIYSEREGVAPDGWKNRQGDRTRKAYLYEKYGRMPRCDMTSTQFLGWKSRLVDHNDGYLIAQWFPTDFAQLFMSLWKTYLKYRASADAHHPYAFISFDSKAFGNPYTINAFNQNYAAALRRIGLEPNKADGLDPHGHRHNYGRRLTLAGLDPLVIKKCLHHASLESQVRYTLPGTKHVSDMLNSATEQLEQSGINQQLAQSSTKATNMDWKSLVEHGFGDIDPQGLYTGKQPKLRSV